jgi:hypothetical protein
MRFSPRRTRSGGTIRRDLVDEARRRGVMQTKRPPAVTSAPNPPRWMPPTSRRSDAKSRWFARPQPLEAVGRPANAQQQYFDRPRSLLTIVTKRWPTSHTAVLCGNQADSSATGNVIQTAMRCFDSRNSCRLFTSTRGTFRRVRSFGSQCRPCVLANFPPRERRSWIRSNSACGEEQRLRPLAPRRQLRQTPPPQELLRGCRCRSRLHCPSSFLR